MPFQPIITVTEIPRNSEYIVIRDATQPYNITTNPTGWGTPGGPTAIGDITSELVQLQYLGELPALVPVVSLSGDLATNLKAVYTLQDGVYLVHGLYGMSAGSSYTVATDKLSLTFPITGATFDNFFGNVGYLANSIDPTNLFRIKSTDNTTGKIELYTTWNLGTGITVLRYWDAVKRILVTNCGNGAIIKDIANMAVAVTGCDPKAVIDLSERIQLQMSAQINFGCGKYVQAHQAASLLCKRKLYTPCTTC